MTTYVDSVSKLNEDSMPMLRVKFEERLKTFRESGEPHDARAIVDVVERIIHEKFRLWKTDSLIRGNK